MDARLDVVKREGRGKNESRRLRAAGRIPAVVYGAQKEGNGVPVAVDPREVLRILHSESGANTLITLKLDGGESRVMVKEYQLDPVTHQLLHADFYQLAMDRAITVTVPILIIGEPKGAKLQGGMLDFVTRELQVQCLPTDIPEHRHRRVRAMLHQAVRCATCRRTQWKPLNGRTRCSSVVCRRPRRSRRRRGRGGCAPVAARSDQEGQDGEGRRGAGGEEITR
jgi:large subunit ribosomal protein L25